jgi:two-component system, cell cycle sensor histidine kinase and response regulator CckA
VLVVEDNLDHASLAEVMLGQVRGTSWKVEHAERLDEAVARLERPGIDAVLLDLNLPDSRGPETASRLCAAAPDAPVVVVTSHADEETGLGAVHAGAQDYLVKGRFDSDVLGRILRMAVERKRAEAAVADARSALSESEERYRLLFEHNPQLLWVFDRATLRILAVNEAACRHYGYTREEFLGLTILDLRPPEEVATILAGIEPADVPHKSAGVYRHRRKDGTPMEMEIQWHAITFDGAKARLVLATDVTDRRRLEEQFLQAQKMEAVGRLAGGVAHDFNNVLSVITGYAELVRRDQPAGSAAARRLDGLIGAVDRAAGLTRQLLTFSRKEPVERRVLDPGALITGMADMLRRLIGEEIQLVTYLSPALGQVRADPGQLEQVLMNLCVNARDAMPGGGRLVIETANVELDEGFARAHLGIAPGAYVMMAVSDTGMGMDASTRHHIFEPFFTTKAPGKGTGLGLSTVYGIVQGSGGSVFVYSEPGQGATFKVYLPRVEDGAEAAPFQARAHAAGGSERILLVEDEPALREIGQELLEEAGYDVVTASAGDEALQVCAQTGTIDLMLTDVVLPRLGGQALLEEARKLRPGLKVIFMSGYTDRVASDLGLLGPGSAFLEKPFTPQALLNTVREVLDS